MCEPLSGGECLELAEALGEEPETVIAVHQLRRGLARAYVVGKPAGFSAAIVQGVHDPTEPLGFGVDADALWRLLQHARGWRCINVSCECSESLASILGRGLGCRVRPIGDVYHVLERRAPSVHHTAVRLLAPEDLALLEVAPPEVQGAGYENAAAMLRDGVVAGAVVAGRLVCIAHTSARTDRFADVGVFTLPAHRGRGLATAAGSLVVDRLPGEGQTPVWSCGEDNWASLRVAQKLGFLAVSRRTYLVPEGVD
ncbi:MAG: GNAT family N-acetyltransferase [Planctomycetota bacterium]|jgi:GNAT superfamily N-acetyltransferase